ncbi:casein kinase I-like [Paramacrobiotus metropolitanus]|uniref:casein kinase I-like n=1 Tax=Paramacrobiotus metropolitanus TaxID=2943436 RepID=UPI0024456693|nr:casein kinase I-like [Paramacrobiotus metropolitanus]
MTDPSNTSVLRKEIERRSHQQAKQNELGVFLPAQQINRSEDWEGLYQVSRGELLIADTWRCVRKIAVGSCSAIYLAYSLDYEKDAAVKMCSFSHGNDALAREAQGMLNLKDGPGIPRLYWFGKGAQRNFLVMELLGPSLLDLFHYCHGRFTLKTVCMLAVQIFEILDWIHRTGYVHREINPQNFCIGSGSASRQIFLIDYATLIKHRGKVDVNGADCIPSVVGTQLKGHALYDTISSHKGLERSYRDDAESSMYMLIYFLLGDLPWRKTPASKEPNAQQSRFDGVLRIKESSVFTAIIPGEMQAALDHVRALPYEERPDYELLIHLFLSMIKNSGASFDYNYDWLNHTTPDELQERVREKRKVLSRLIAPDVGAFLALQTHRRLHQHDSMDDLLHDVEHHQAPAKH